MIYMLLLFIVVAFVYLSIRDGDITFDSAPKFTMPPDYKNPFTADAWRE